MKLKFLYNWCNAIIAFFMEKPGVQYMRPLSTPRDVDSDHEVALVMDRQRSAFLKLKASGKSCLNGYRPPELIVGDRIDVHFKKEGVVPPTELRRTSKPLTVREGHKGAKAAR